MARRVPLTGTPAARAARRRACRSASVIDLRPGRGASMRKEGGVGGSPAGRSGGAGSLFGRLLLALAADDAAGETDPVWDQQVEALAALVRPDGADFDPLRFAVAALSRVDDDVSGMGWLVAHGVFPSFRGRHNGVSMRPGHGAVPCARRGETREGDRQACTERSDGRLGYA